MCRKIFTLCICLLLVFSVACTKRATSQREPPVNSEESEPAPISTPEYIFTPDYKEGEQNTVWGNTSSNISHNRNDASITKQGNYLYYSLFFDGAIYKMPVWATSAEDVECILEPETVVNDYIDYLQVLGDWMYFRGDNGSVYRMRTDGTSLEKLFTLDSYTNFVVYKNRIYYTKSEDVNITADSYAYKHMLMSSSLDGLDTRCDFLSEEKFSEFYIECYDPAGYLYLFARSPSKPYSSEPRWMLYSLEDASCIELAYAGWTVGVGWDSTTYLKYDYRKKCEYALSHTDVINQNFSKIKDSEGMMFSSDGPSTFNADDGGFYFAYESSITSFDTKIGYYDYKSGNLLSVCPDDALRYFLPGDGYLYYLANGGWCRIYTVNGLVSQQSWERVDWMKGMTRADDGTESFE